MHITLMFVLITFDQNVHLAPPLFIFRIVEQLNHLDVNLLAFRSGSRCAFVTTYVFFQMFKIKPIFPSIEYPFVHYVSKVKLRLISRTLKEKVWLNLRFPGTVMNYIVL